MERTAAAASSDLGAMFGIVAGQYGEIDLFLEICIGVMDERLKVEIVLLPWTREMEVTEVNPREDGMGVVGCLGRH